MLPNINPRLLLPAFADLLSKRMLRGRYFGMLVIFLWIHQPGAFAKITINWTGAAGTDWNTAGNWSPQVVPGPSDDVQIGVVAFNNSNQPAVSSILQCGTVTFGPAQAVTLTINTGAGLMVNGVITQSHGQDNLVPYAIIAGNGSLTCTSLVVGDGTPSKVVDVKITKMVSALANFTVTGNVYINSVTSTLLSGGLAHNNGVFSLQAGLLTVGGQIKLTNLVPSYLSGALTGLTPSARFSIDISAGRNPQLVMLGNPSVNITDGSWDTIDFYNGPGSGSSLVSYGGGDQMVATRSTSGIDTNPQPYENLVVSGTGVKNTEDSTGDSLIVGGYLQVQGATLDLRTKNATLSVAGDFTNTGTVKLSKAAFSGASFKNWGNITTGTDTIQFNGTNQSLTDSTLNGTAMQIVLFSNAAKTISKGRFILPAGGNWTVANDSTTIGISPGAQLTFHADSTGQSAMTFKSVDGIRRALVLNRSAVTANPLVRQAAPPASRAAIITLGPPRSATGLTSAPSVRSAAKPAVPVLRIKMSGGKNEFENLLIRFKNNASARYMPSEDKYYLGGNKKITVKFYSYASDRAMLATNSLPLPKQAQTIGLYANAAKAGNYTLTFYGAGDIPAGYGVNLRDKLTGSTIDLKTQAVYPFSIARKNKNTYGDRFQLLITPPAK